MKKLSLIITILLVAVMCSACVNNLAIQQLNNKAKEYLKAGDAQSAVCRLKSSLDLDANFFETNYNLGIAYIDLKDWENAKDAIEQAIKINPDFEDSYYSLGIIYENLADNKANPQEDDTDVDEDESSETDTENPVELTAEDKTEIVGYYNKAIESYEKFAQKTPDVKTKNDILQTIESIKAEIEKYSDGANSL